MEQPRNVWVPSIGTSRMLFYTGDKFPGWKGGATEDPQRAVWTAAGSGGQFLFVIPRHDLVVAVTASAADFASPVGFLFDDIISSVR